jgi:hypothetical protein
MNELRWTQREEAWWQNALRAYFRPGAPPEIQGIAEEIVDTNVTFSQGADIDSNQLASGRYRR